MNPELRNYLNIREGKDEGIHASGLCNHSILPTRCRFMVELPNGTRICKVSSNPCNYRVLSDDPEDIGFWNPEDREKVLKQREANENRVKKALNDILRFIKYGRQNMTRAINKEIAALRKEVRDMISAIFKLLDKLEKYESGWREQNEYVYRM